MNYFYDKVIKHRKIILTVFFLLCFVCIFCKQMVSVNYDMNSYLPDGTASTVALDVMEEEFDLHYVDIHVEEQAYHVDFDA